VTKAIRKGVEALRGMQRPDGTWPHAKIGATALAGRTLLECGVGRDDPAVVKAAKAVRGEAVACHDTDSLALSILFLDRLGDPHDIALIESMAVRLLAGQNAAGGWTYTCPDISAAEVDRLEAHVRNRADAAKPIQGRRTYNDLHPAIKKQLRDLGKSRPIAVPDGGDNCNTQFAALGLWTARRYGIPVTNAMGRLYDRFRASQHRDGGWGYKTGENDTTPTMTCAGVLVLSMVHGVAAEAGKRSEPDKDPNLTRGLRKLSNSVTDPVGDRKEEIPRVKDKFYYLVWSLGRDCLICDLKTVDKKDWYAWGVEIVLANQGPNGLWYGEFFPSGADTCFALLFLKRASLAADLKIKKKDG
jgi:hypothetical protein